MSYHTNWSLSWKARHFIFKFIRPFFVKDVDPNEDYNCVICCKPVLRRDFVCSSKECHIKEAQL